MSKVEVFLNAVIAGKNFKAEYGLLIKYDALCGETNKKYFATELFKFLEEFEKSDGIELTGGEITDDLPF